MLRTFNMGIGMIVAVARHDVARVTDVLTAAGERQVFVIGEAKAGRREVEYVA